MPHGSIWFPEPEYTREDIIQFFEKLAEKAEALGYTTHGGPKAGRGNVRRLLEAIVWEEVHLRTDTGCEHHANG